MLYLLSASENSPFRSRFTVLAATKNNYKAPALIHALLPLPW